MDFSSEVRGGTPAIERFFCTLRSPGFLFCYIIKGKQLLKSLDLAVNEVAPTPIPCGLWDRNFMSKGVINCSTGVLPPCTPRVQRFTDVALSVCVSVCLSVYISL